MCPSGPSPRWARSSTGGDPAIRWSVAAYCAALDLEPVAFHEDAGISAKSLDRPGLRDALADLESGRAGALVVFKLDRLTRSIVDVGHLLDRYFSKRFALISVSEQLDTRTAMGRMLINLLTTFSQAEREVIAERTATAMRHLRSQGVRVGTVPLGYRTGGIDANGRDLLVRDEAEQAVVARIREMRGEGRTLREIADILTAEKVPTKRGGAWAAETVRKILQRAEMARAA